jgi:hypothetical protein
MKSCPKCNIEYLDNTLEFCLEDGSKLFTSKNEIPTNAKTAILNDFPKPSPNNFEISKEIILRKKETDKLANIKEKVTYQSNKVIETAPIVVALIHNYWQWLYLEKANYGTTIAFLTSGQFSIWLSLLVVGAITSFIALKYGKNKGFAITGLVILAINLLLSIVPIK